jgi:ribulose-phosphate 3-epimerase
VAAPPRPPDPPVRPDRVQIAPSILSADFTRLAEEIRTVEAAGADMLHLDVMDGHFVPNITFGPMVVGAVRRLTKLFLDVHLMIAEPGRYAAAFVKSGANRLLVQIETAPDPLPLLAEIRGLGAQAGLVLNPETPFESVEPFLADIDCLLVMSVHPGFGGQKFLPDVLPKVVRARDLRDMNGWTWPIEIDGGIDAGTAGAAVEAGVNILVAGNAVFGSGNAAEAMARIRAAGDGAGGEAAPSRQAGRTDEGFL